MTTYQFHIMSGMPGYMPNFVSTHSAGTRKEFADTVRDALDMLDYPANRFGEFEIRRMWRFVQRAKSGSNVHSFCSIHNGERMTIQGMNDADYMTALREEDI
jgi:hypothetical protein